MKAFLLVALVAVTHYGYPDAQPWASWWFYVFRGIEGAAIFLLLAQHSKGVALVACLWGALEETQTAVCGYLAMGTEGSPVCFSVVSTFIYGAFASAALVYLWGRRDR